MPLRTFRDVINLWPSPDALAADIGAGKSAVRKWPQRDNIPSEWWRAILSTKRAREAGLTAEAMIDLGAAAGSARPSNPDRASA